ncbi:MAG: hypothetical protein A2017_20900 [Lentisphaerae bacterium GWF2_44_16]|nr:MAG: hypothetical protein A2017_20900 [Lentisphaerae bacterium GWF2_44_16]
MAHINNKNRIEFIHKGRGGQWTRLSFQCPVTEIFRICLVKRKPYHHIITNSPPGHTFQCVKKGRFDLVINGIKYNIRKGDILYLGSSEIEEATAYKEGFEFISVVFLAPSLEPLPPEARVFKGAPKIEKLFDRLYEIYSKEDKIQGIVLYHTLFELLMEIYNMKLKRNPLCSKNGKWWEIEEFIRSKRAFRISVKEICDEFEINKIALAALCMGATSLSPAKRIQAIRMAEARGLLLYSENSVSQIADLLGYPRIHEFSREFTNYFGYSPKEFVEKDRDLLDEKSTGR